MEKSYYERNKMKILSNLRDKYQKDDEYRNKIQEKYRQRYHEDEEYRNATVARSRAQYERIKNIMTKSQAS